MCSTADDLNGTGESLDPHAWAVRNGSPGALDVPIEEGVVSPPAHGSFAIQLVGPPSVEKRCASSQGTPIPVARKLRKSCDFCCQRKRKCDGDGLSSCRFVTYRSLSLRGAWYLLREGMHLAEFNCAALPRSCLDESFEDRMWLEDQLRAFSSWKREKTQCWHTLRADCCV